MASTSGDDAQQLEALRPVSSGASQLKSGVPGNDTTDASAGATFGQSVKAVLFEGIDQYAFIRAGVVIAVIVALVVAFCCVRAVIRTDREWTHFSERRRRLFTYGGGSRRYDALSAKQLQPELVVDSDDDEDSDAELFNSAHKSYAKVPSADTIRLVKTTEQNDSRPDDRQADTTNDTDSMHRRR